ncbi:MAG: xerD 2 [Planctomycetaceae bacterium]|nr:xerD 2 [Planctomycetaceae bacterium]
MTARDTWALTRDMFLSEEEVDAIRGSIRQRLTDVESPAWCSAKTDELIFEVLTFSGIRNSEFCHLRVRDVPPALKQPVLQVAETPRQDRIVAIPQSLAELIRDYVRKVRPQLLHDSIPVKDVDQPLALNDRGRPFDRTTLYRRVVKILTAAGFETRASVQLLRHTYGYLAYKRTRGNLLFVQQQLGHAHPMVTAVYAEFVEFSHSELANLVAGEPGKKRPK